MTRFLHIITIFLLLSLLQSCGTPRRLSKASLADAVWTFSQTHPDGFTLDIRTLTEPTEGISVAYAATQNSHGREALDAVVSHATAHEGFVGGWLDTSDSLYYFDSVRLFPEDSLEAAVNFSKGPLLSAVQSYGAKIIYEYSIISGIAIKVPGDIIQAIAFFARVKGVTAVDRDHIYHLTDPVKPRLEVR